MDADISKIHFNDKHSKERKFYRSECTILQTNEKENPLMFNGLTLNFLMKKLHIIMKLNPLQYELIQHHIAVSHATE
jgi:hypothetical protein